MSTGNVRIALTPGRADITIERPSARNAMTFAMYDELEKIFDSIPSLGNVGAITIGGVDDAFIAGTDIAEFAAFKSGEDGLEYERRVEAIISRIETLPAPSIAVIDGPAMGGGLIIAAACDFRLVSNKARFGVPMARTLGNCLSSRNILRLKETFGISATRAMLFLGRILSAEDALRSGFALEAVPQADLAARTDALVAELRANAPMTIAAGRESLRRLAVGRLDDGDILETVYASKDFAGGVQSFLGKRRAVWRDRPQAWPIMKAPE